MVNPANGQLCDTNLFPGGKQFYDTYHPVAAEIENWQHYNTHDPTVNKQGEWYYMYSTDASWGNRHETGALKRRSRDLVNWEFLGTAFDGVPQSAAEFFQNSGNPGYTDAGIWAPYLLKYKGKYILYYSAPGGLNGITLSYIGYATSDSAAGPWTDQGMITTSKPIFYDGNTLVQDTINAIDPTVVFDSVEGRLWMTYGSWHTGLYILELDTATGGIKTPGDRGTSIAARNNNRGLEGPEIIYRNGWYYLFVSYDRLDDFYNVRVGRSRSASGPYYDIDSIDMAAHSDNYPMILSPYRFSDHFGWQGTAHCGVFNDGGTYYMFNQGRPSIEPTMMVLHVRKIFWLNDWPVLSPERYAGVHPCQITSDSLVGTWQHMPLIYRTSLYYHSTPADLDLSSDGTFNGDPGNTWILDSDTLWLNWSNGDIHKLIVFRGWDWEYQCETVLFTGMDTEGTCIWGKKVNRRQADGYTRIVHGGTYSIRNLHSHLLLQTENNLSAPATTVKQGYDRDSWGSQLWKIKEAGPGYYYFFPQHNEDNLVMEVFNSNPGNSAYIVINPINGTDRQKFSINYNDNGYFHILSKVSNEERCLDVANFSVLDGAMVFQWDYLGGLNQLWRFKLIDSIPLDTEPADTFTLDAGEMSWLTDIKIFPNPSQDGKFTIDISSLKDNDIPVQIIDARGISVFNTTFTKPSAYELQLDLPEGIYLVRIGSANRYVKRLIIH